MYWLALIVVLAEHSAGGAWVAAAVVARLTPRLLFGAIGGAVADRFDRRALLMVLDGSRAAVMLVLTVLTALDAPPWTIVAIVFITCTLGTPYRPAVCASIPRLVDERILGPTNAIWSTVGQTINLIGPVLGLALLAIGEPWWAFAVNAASFACSVALIATIAHLGGRPPGAPGPGPAAPSQVLDGWRAVRVDPGLTALVAVVAAFMVLRGFELVLHVEVASDRLGLGAAGYGWLSAAAGVGAIAVVPLTTRGGLERRPSVVLLVSSLAGCASLGVLASTSHVGIALTAVALEGAGIVVFEVAAITLVQLAAPTDLVGRVVGIQNSVSGAAKLAGALLAPVAVAALGLRGGLVAVAVIAAVAMAIASRNLADLAPATEASTGRVFPIVTVLAPLDLFDGVPALALQRLARTARDEPVLDGAPVVSQGEPADDFFVVERGTFTVSIDGTEVGRLGPGEAFGELGLLTRSPRAATVAATGDASVMRFPGDEFLRAVTTASAVADPLLDGIIEKPVPGDDRSPRR